MPLPSCAPGTNPATSMTSTGIYLIPLTDNELFGFGSKPNSLLGHGFLT